MILAKITQTSIDADTFVSLFIKILSILSKQDLASDKSITFEKQICNHIERIQNNLAYQPIWIKELTANAMYNNTPAERNKWFNLYKWFQARLGWFHSMFRNFFPQS